MHKGEEKYCPRCSTAFECNAGSIHLCRCTTVTLNENETGYIRVKYDDCLCSSCMQETKAEYKSSKLNNRIKENFQQFLKEQKKICDNKKVPAKKDLIEEEDYYINEKGQWVFTELYHLKRGYCCNNGCKHCPYDNRKDN